VRSLKSVFTGKLLISHLRKAQKGLYTKDYEQTQLFLHKRRSVWAGVWDNAYTGAMAAKADCNEAKLGL